MTRKPPEIIAKLYMAVAQLPTKAVERIRTGIARPFTGRKLPGWASIILGALERLALQEERIREAFHLVRDLGSEPAMLVSALESPIFSIALIAGGVGYLIFVGEPKAGTVRHRWWPVVGWSIAAICLAVIVSVFGYGYFQLRVMEVATPQIETVQQKALGGQLFWHLTDGEKFKLGEALDQVPESERFEVKIWALPTNSNSQTYGSDLAEVFTNHHWKIAPDFMFNNLRRDLVGLSISVSKKYLHEDKTMKPSEFPPNVQKLAQILVQAGIGGEWSWNDGLKDDDFAIAIGNGPK